MENIYDVVVIGAGPGGLTVAIGMAKAGKKVALVEKGPIGGDCTNYGCVPSKALLHISKQSNTVQEALTEVRNKREKILQEESEEKIEEHGVEVIKGEAKFLDKCHISVDGGEKIKSKKFVIATGSSPNMISIDGLDDNDILTNETVFEQTENFNDLIIFGGGYIGCELAQAFANIGISVNLILRSDKLIPKEEPEAIQLMDKHLKNKGVKIYYKTTPKYAKDGYMYFESNGEEVSIKYDKILMSIGRKPNVNGMDLENGCIDYDKTGIKVNKYNKTSNGSVFAIGDCVSGNYLFTHWVGNEGRTLVRNLLFPLWKKDPGKNVVTSCVYTDTEFARTGKTYEELKELYGENSINSKIYYFENNDRSIVTNQTEGFVKINFKRLTGKILSASIASKNAGEMINVLSIAKQNKITAYKLSEHIFPYPTKSEAIKHTSDLFVFDTLANIKREIKNFLKLNMVPIIAFLIRVSIIFSFFVYKNINGLTTGDIMVSIYSILTGTMLGPFIYIFFFMMRPIVFIPATFFTLLAGMIYGSQGGLWLLFAVIIPVVGETLSGSFAYFLASIFGKNIISPESKGVVADIKEKLSKSSFMPVLILRLAGTPFDVLSYGAGFVRAKFWGYFWGTFFGIIPGVIAFVLVGSGIDISDFEKIVAGEKSPEINPYILLSGVVIFVLSLVIAKFVSKKFNAKKV